MIQARNTATAVCARSVRYEDGEQDLGRDLMKQFAARALLALGLLFPAPLAAQDYPSKPIRIIVPFAAGGPADMIARAIAPTMSATLKQTVVIENKAGAGGAVGVDTVARLPLTATPSG
jgi:tripartite-type tricarboxylate transporter receptor subunit TctC